MVKSWILPLKCNYKLQTAIKGETLLLKVTVSGTPRVAYEHGHIQLPTEWGLSCQQSWGLLVWPVLIFIMSSGNADFLVQGQFPKWQLGKAVLLKSWDKRAGILIYSLASFCKKPGMKQQNFQESHHLGQLPFGWVWFRKLFRLFFFFKIFYVDKLPFRTPRAR